MAQLGEHTLEAVLQSKLLQPSFEEESLKRVAMNIVNQILDLAGTDVPTRQAINDRCDAFVKEVLQKNLEVKLTWFQNAGEQLEPLLLPHLMAAFVEEIKKPETVERFVAMMAVARKNRHDTTETVQYALTDFVKETLGA